MRVHEGELMRSLMPELQGPVLRRARSWNVMAAAIDAFQRVSNFGIPAMGCDHCKEARR
jgi:hypothetical protein